MRLPKLSLSEWFLRIGIAFAFLYPPIDALTDPYSWIGYFPSFITDFVAPHSMLLLHAFGVVEVLLALWILLGKRIWIPCLVAVVMLAAIILFNIPQFPVLFRDVSIAFMAAALGLGDWYSQRSRHGVS